MKLSGCANQEERGITPQSPGTAGIFFSVEPPDTGFVVAKCFQLCVCAPFFINS